MRSFAGASLLLASLTAVSIGCDPAETASSASPQGEPAKSTLVVREDSADLDLEIEKNYDEIERRFQERLPKLKEIQERFEKSFFEHPGATSIGIGLDVDMVTPVFRISVTDKDLVRKLPSEIEGVATDVRVSETPRLLDGGPTCNGGMGPPCHTDPQPLPVEMGNSGAWILGSACSMGFKACDLGTGTSVLVTNSHCAQYAAGCAMAPVGFPFEHPGPMDQVPAGSGVSIGTISGHSAPVCGSLGNYVDATKVESAFYQSSRDHRDIGTPKRELVGPSPGLRIHYSGRSSGYNSGLIEAVNVTLVVPATGGFCCGAVVMRDQISFDPLYSVVGGDSGSGVLAKMPGIAKLHNRVVGLLFASDGTLGYANNIERVLTDLNLTLDFTECGYPEGY